MGFRFNEPLYNLAFDDAYPKSLGLGLEISAQGELGITFANVCE